LYPTLTGLVQQLTASLHEDTEAIMAVVNAHLAG
jgi:hypothetical protein